LVDRGRAELERAVLARVSFVQRVSRLAARFPLVVMVGTIALITAAAATGLLQIAIAGGLRGWLLLPVGALAALAASQFASALTNWLATLLVTPKALPRMDFASGLPGDMRTLVVVPTLLTSPDSIDELVEALEVRFLGNRDSQLGFCLLSDFCDAPTERLDADEPLLRRARDGIEALNQKYADAGTGPFFLLHRPRRWNAADRSWMGHERKRGKLADLNAALLSGDWSGFSSVAGDVDFFADVRYVITLDTDTLLPRDAARQFVGVMAHPLNHAQHDDARGRVTAGYGILQPRMAATLSGADRSWYAQLCGQDPGIDPYTRSVSDVYQDVFGEGSFIGKGIYDVVAFERALGSRFPDNRILSHDLLEGCYARSGLLSDVPLYEECPARYSADVSRQERWIRGDWQVARWLLPRVPGPGGRSLPNPLSALSRWKIFDNLRRSLVPAALVALFLFGWLFVPRAAAWTLMLFGFVLLPPVIALIVELMDRSREALLGQHLSATANSAGQGLALSGFRIACLPHEAAISLNAILRACWRMLFSHRRMLEWQASGSSARERGGGAALSASYRWMWVAPLIAAASATGLAFLRPGALPVAGPVLALWLAAPALAWLLSRPLVQRAPRLSADQTRFLRRTAIRTWSFFDRFVTAEENWLPPDNFQEDPGPVVAHRTSPTNIGLALLANLSACDFGYITTGQLLDRTRDTFATLARLQRHHGHFFNWYDTRTLQPLAPRYISSVDSGNLAGHLLTLRPALLALPGQAAVNPRLFDGLLDAIELLPSSSRPVISGAGPHRPSSLRATWRALGSLATAAQAVPRTGAAFAEADAAAPGQALQRQCDAALEELRRLAPWLDAVPGPAGLGDLPHSLCALLGIAGANEATGIPTLRELVDATAALQGAVTARIAVATTSAEREWLPALAEQLAAGQACASAMLATAEALATQAVGFAAMEYEFLYDRAQHLLAIGYNVDDFRRDTSFYDLLASEARLCSFVVVAQGKLPQESWFALGRRLTTAGGKPVLMSWSGSMFEYLMPLLVMPSYAGTLLDQACRAAVARQIAFGRQRGLPWGVSESGYNSIDAGLNYQYHAFGVPGLGLKRGLADDSVVAPYASALALMVDPEAACANLQLLAADGLEGRYGLYEAIDYTPSRLARGQSAEIVRSFMAHHQGMVLLSIGNLLLDRPMQKRFESDPLLQATLLLLQERVPRTIAPRSRVSEQAEASSPIDLAGAAIQPPIRASTPSPEVNLLSNGRYSVMVTNAGGGYSRWKDLAVTRWREDATRDNWGMFVYLRDVVTGEFWSAGHQPTLRAADSYEAVFSEGRAEFRRRDQDVETYTELVVSPEDDIELRRVRITNHSYRRRTMEITSYAEVVLAVPAADAMQPSFGNLFVQTEILDDSRAILCTRRPRSRGEATPWMFHMLATNGSAIDSVSFETDRMRFIGRGGTAAAPAAMEAPGTLSGTAGSVLDPIVAIRCQVTLEAEQAVTIDFVTGATDDRTAAIALVKKYH
ncbi:MAG: cyclic beta 1-2 glucan synthetase, partial [Burkholderiales bacterium]|nr:cyclic beta 1-2 glucan synthetase [Burkholderiales bacterium]